MLIPITENFKPTTIYPLLVVRKKHIHVYPDPITLFVKVQLSPHDDVNK